MFSGYENGKATALGALGNFVITGAQKSEPPSDDLCNDFLKLEGVDNMTQDCSVTEPLLLERYAFVAMTYVEERSYQNTGVFSRLRSMCYNILGTSCINETDGSILNKHFGSVINDSPELLDLLMRAHLNLPKPLVNTEFYDYIGRMYLNGNERLGIKGHNNLFTQHAFRGKSASQLKLKPEDLRGALKKHFSVNETDNWMNQMIIEKN